MKVKIKFKPTSRYWQFGHTEEIFEDVTEVHYNYQGKNRTAIECKTTGYVYDNNDDIFEMEITG